MARPKKIKEPKKVKDAAVEILPTPEPVLDTVVHISIAKLAIDYPSEGLNNMARKINEIIDHLQ